MGQQQLLLVILVTIIVGIATVVAINTFSSAADSANVDATRQDILSMASTAQGYYMKPSMMGGGGNKFTGLDFTKLNLKPSDGSAVASGDVSLTNENAKYDLTVAAQTVTVTATLDGGSSSNSLTAEITPDDINWTDNDPSS